VYDGSAKTVSVYGTGTGTVSNIKYAGSATAPTNAGTYPVTFDVAAVAGVWNAANNLSAGTLVISKGDPVAGNFDASGLSQAYNGAAKTVSVSAKWGVTGMGTVSNIRYNGSATAPSAIGTYSITFDVAEGKNYNAANGLSAAETLTISKGYPAAGDFTFSGLIGYDGTAKTVTVTAKETVTGMGYVSNIRYDGSATAPSAVGTYSITINVAEGTNYSARNNLSVGTLTIADPFTFATTLTENTWADGNLPSGGEQWFKFTATATTQYIHFKPGTLTDVYVQLYDSTGGTVGSQTRLYDSSSNISRSVTIGSEYCIKVTPFSSSYSGTYQIVFNASALSPTIINNAIQLTANTWADGNLPSNGEQWFKFTATATTQYIHFKPGTLTDVYLQLYDITGATVGSQMYSSTTYDRSVTIGSVYYIKVIPYSNSGTYQIGFNAFPASPTIINNAIQLTANTWADGNLSTNNGQQWFKFTATADTQYIHFKLTSYVNVQLYDSTGATVGSQTTMYSSTYTDRSVTIGSVYYIKVTQAYATYGAYQIGFNTSTTRPD